jgi:hypothetical protein
MSLPSIYSIKILVYKLIEYVLGKRITLSLYKKYLFRNYSKSGIVFIHIPKAGGTSVSNLLYGKRAGHFTACEIKDCLGEDSFRSMKSFAVVRNPVDRLISAYKFILNSGGSHGSYRRNSDLLLPDFVNFDTFVKDWLVKQDPGKVELLFRPQYLFIYNDKGECLVDWFCKIENAEELESRLFNLTGNKMVLPKLNTSFGKKLRIQYSDETRSLIMDYYQKDFEYFDYNS